MILFFYSFLLIFVYLIFLSIITNSKTWSLCRKKREKLRFKNKDKIKVLLFDKNKLIWSQNQLQSNTWSCWNEKRSSFLRILNAAIEFKLNWSIPTESQIELSFIYSKFFPLIPFQSLISHEKQPLYKNISIAWMFNLQTIMSIQEFFFFPASLFLFNLVSFFLKNIEHFKFNNKAK